MSRLKFGILAPLVLTALPMPAITQMNIAKDSEKLTQTQKAILQVEEEIFTAVKNQDTGVLEPILTDNFVRNDDDESDCRRTS